MVVDIEGLGKITASKEVLGEIVLVLYNALEKSGYYDREDK